jgi:hypothetical protein
MIIETNEFHPNLDQLMCRLHIKPGSQFASEFEELVRQTQTIARPKAIFEAAHIDKKGKDTVIINGVKFSSRILSVNLAEADQVFVHVATCGVELDQWASAFSDDILQSFWSAAIREAALYTVAQALDDHLLARYQLAHLSTMHPGSLGDWPLAEQQPLFSLFADVKQAIGVELTDSLLMVPTKSVSGISFPTQVDFESCQLCQREDCPNRRAPYDAMLYAQKYQ